MNQRLLDDAEKCLTSTPGQALLQWDWEDRGDWKLARHSIQMPEDVVDLILYWRDQSKTSPS